jgi:Rhodopirellula transposase DDE domain
VHDFIDEELGKAVPYGVYDIGENTCCVSVGINDDTAQFAVNAVRRAEGGCCSNA